jgi:hypothetical protein
LATFEDFTGRLGPDEGLRGECDFGDLGEELLNHWPTVFAEIVQNLVDRGQWLRPSMMATAASR